MMKESVDYKGHCLWKNSEALRLYHEAQKDRRLFKKLDDHLKDVDRREKELLARL
ncbi:hypothetical protein FDI24_gp202 [Acidovorax phage ACP17]|uniref:Uncharacterized protein n=1 Tax=Acidovorax phage ACP17 TaxID=2010329 RepID=A0A218M358_9CAUD|nr:hypothetical protein FDI24_gp202 [Acidovorax phage ACP17]ASD50483.1 hypothetical protein [Acidovorax phage ACP17]